MHLVWVNPNPPQTIGHDCWPTMDRSNTWSVLSGRQADNEIRYFEVIEGGKNVENRRTR